MSSSSRLQELWDRHETVWRQLQDIEKRLDESAVRKRRRIANLLDETSTHRLSHLRLFVTHSVSPKNSFHWTLVVEGRLLVGHLDHKSATQVEQEAAEAAGVDIASHIEASSSTTPTASSPSAAGAAGSSTDATAPLTAAPTTAAHSATTAPLMIRSTDRTQYRGISEKEGDVPVEPIQFTHLFDKMTVTFQTIYQPQSQKPAKKEEPKTPTTKSRSKSKRSSKMSDEKRNKALEEEALQRLLTTSAVTEVVWNRQDSPDAQAFCVNYNSPPPSTTTDIHSVVATISLYPCPGPEAQYQPSPKLAAALFPQHVIYDSSKSTDNKKRKATSSSTTPSKKKRKKSSNTDGGAASTEEEQPDVIADEDVVIPIENDIVVSPKLSLQEIVSALFLYIREKKLMDESDQSMIVNNKTLENLFECERMPLADLQERLISLNLIEKINRHENPIVLTYIMKRDTTSPSPLEKSAVPPQEETKAPQQQHDESVAKKSSEEAAPDAGNKQKRTEEEDDPLHHHSSILSFDMDVHIPGLLHYRARELMRRIKRREFEYTSSRTKARNLLMVSSSRSGGVREEVVKTRIEEAVCGRGFTVDHVPVWLALAKAAPPGSEARMAAQIDARTCVLLDRLEHHCRAAKAAWDIVDACRARGGSTNESK